MCDPQCSLESVNKENNTTITTSKKQITFKPDAKSQSNKDKNHKSEYDIKKFLKYCPSAPCERETLENESVERENTIEVQKSTSAPIKLQYVECQNNNEDKQVIALQTNPALYDPECVKNQKEYVEETDIGIQTNSSQYVITKSQKQNELQYVECQNNNEENKKIPALNSPECVKGQNIYDVEKYNPDQTIYRNISTEQIKSIDPNYTEEKEIAVQTNPAQTHKECLKRQIKYGREKKSHAQTKYIQHRNITKERIECKPCVNTHNYNEENKVYVHKSPESVDSECFNRQTKNKRENDTSVKKRTSALIKPECVPCKNYNEEEKDIGVQTNPAQHVTITNEQEQTEPGNVEYINNNKGEEKIVTQPNAALIDPEKNQQEYVEETDIGVQTNPSQYVTTKSQKQSKLQYVDYKNNNEENKEIAVKISPASTNSECVKCGKKQKKSDVEKYNPDQTIYRNISEEQIKSKGQNHDEEKEIVVQTNPVPTDQECLKRQIKYKREKKTAAQTKLIKYRNISKERIDGSYVGIENSNNKYKEIVIQPNPALTGPECMKWQNKNDGEKNAGVYSKYIKFRNISGEQIEHKPCSKIQNYYEVEEEEEEEDIVVQTNPAPTDQECLKRQIKYEREIETSAQTKLIKYRNISREGIDGSYVGIQNNNNNYEEIVIQPNPALTSPECMKWQNKNDEEKNAGVHSKYIKFRNISGEQIEHNPCGKIRNYNEKEEEEEEEIVVQTNPAPTNQECLKRKINYEREKETSAQTKVIKYRNISKERIDGSHVGIQNNNNNYEEIVIQPNPALTSPECMKWQNKNDVEKNAGVHSKYIKLRNISGEQIEHKPCGKIQNFNEEEKEIVVKTNPAPTDQECLKRKIKYEREKETAAQTKYIQYRNRPGEQIEHKPCGKIQNFNEEDEKEIVVKTNPAPTDQECLKRKIKYEREKETAAQTKYIQYRNRSGEQIEHKPCGKIQNFNEEEEKEIVVKTNPAPTDQECLKRKIKYEREKETAAQTKYIQYRNSPGEDIEYKPKVKIQNYNEEEKEIAVQTNPAPTDQECLKRKIKYEKEKETAAQTKYIQYRNISKERIDGSYVGIQNNNNKYKEIVIQPNPALTGPEGIKWQNKHDGKKHVDVHSKYIQFRNRSGEHIEYKPSGKIQNYNEEEKEISVQTNPTPTDQECLKRQIKYEREKETAAQTKYIQYRNISKDRIDGSYVGIQNNNNKHKEIVIQPNPASMQLMKWQNKNEEKKHVDVHSKYIQFRNRSREHIEYKPSVKIQNYNEEEENEIAVQTSPAPTDPECLRSQIKHKSEKETAAKTEYMQYKNISKERIDEPYVKSQSNTSENKNALQPCSTLTDQECMKRQSKNVEEKNIDVQGKYIEYRNIDYVKNEIICTSATCVAKTLENESETIAVQTRISAPIELECNEIQNDNEEKKDIGLQINPAQPINKEQKQTEPEYVKSEINQYYANQDNIESRNEKQTSKKCEAFISKVIDSTEYFENESDKQEKDIDVLCKKLTKKTFAHTCIENEKYSNYVTSKDYSKPKNFQHLFTRKNFGNSSQYNTKEENLHGCCITCSKYMTTADYNKPERFARLFSVPKLWDTEDSKLIKSSDDYSKDLISQNSKRKYEKSVPKLWNTKDSKLIKFADDYGKNLISQNSKRIDSKDFTKQYTFEVVCKDEKSDDEYLALKQRKVKEIINPNTSTVYRYAKKCIENRTILKSLIYTKNKPEKSKANESNSATSIYGMLKNMFANN